MSIHFSPKYKKDILVDKNKQIWMDYETGTLHYDSCWLDELPVDVLREITKHIWTGYYNNCKTIQYSINPHIEFCNDTSIREKHSHNVFGSVDTEKYTKIDEAHPFNSLYYARECQGVSSNRYLGCSYSVMDKPDWMNDEFIKLKINGKKQPNFCHSITDNKIMVSNKYVNLCSKMVDWRDDPCPCLVRKYKNWIKQRKYNLVYEDGLIKNNMRQEYRFYYETCCDCEDEITFHPLVLQLFTLMYRNGEMNFCKFYEKAYHMSPDVDWDKFKLDAKRGNWSSYHRIENLYYRRYIKNNIIRLESSLFNYIAGASKYEHHYGWLWINTLDNLMCNLSTIKGCCGFTKDGNRCKVRRSGFTIQIFRKELGEFANAKKVFPYKKDRGETQHLNMCGKCKDKYCKYTKKDKSSKIPVMVYNEREMNYQNVDGFKIVEFMKDYNYEIRNGYLISNSCKLYLEKRYSKSSLEIDVSKHKYFGE